MYSGVILTEKLGEKNTHLVSWNSPSTQSMQKRSPDPICSDLSIIAYDQLRALVDLLCVFPSLEFCFWSCLRTAVSFYFSIAASAFKDQQPCPCIRSLKVQRKANSFLSTKANTFFPWRKEENRWILSFIFSLLPWISILPFPNGIPCLYWDITHIFSSSSSVVEMEFQENPLMRKLRLQIDISLQSYLECLNLNSFPFFHPKLFYTASP